MNTLFKNKILSLLITTSLVISLIGITPIKVSADVTGQIGVQYKAHIQNIGWQKWVSDGQEAGTDGKFLRVEAIRIKVNNLPGYSVQYRVQVQNKGWTGSRNRW